MEDTTCRARRGGFAGGFTVMELLFVLLIMSMMLTASTSGIQTAREALYTVTDVDNAEVLRSTTLTLLRDTLDKVERVRLDDASVDADGNKVVEYFYISGKGYMKFENAANSGFTDPKGIQLSVYNGDPASSAPVTADLLPEGASGESDARRKFTLYTTLESVQYNEAKGMFTIQGLRVMKQPQGGGAAQQVIDPMDFSFRAINQVDS